MRIHWEPDLFVFLVLCLIQVFAKPKKLLTEEDLMKKAEVADERRRRASRLKREQQVGIPSNASEPAFKSPYFCGS